MFLFPIACGEIVQDDEIVEIEANLVKMRHCRRMKLKLPDGFELIWGKHSPKERPNFSVWRIILYNPRKFIWTPLRDCGDIERHRYSKALTELIGKITG